jgi:hypothetical protein
MASREAGQMEIEMTSQKVEFIPWGSQDGSRIAGMVVAVNDREMTYTIETEDGDVFTVPTEDTFHSAITQYLSSTHPSVLT